MQAEPDSSTHLDNKEDVNGINFRPSSNFIYMKKYRKGTVVSNGGESTTEMRSEDDESRGDSSGSSSLEIGPREYGPQQPPLPRDPPPPDSPIRPKEEVMDEEYRSDGEPQEPTENNGTERSMCREFARGACTRGSACKYAHEIIVSQLPGIYTFCKDYQNATCTFPRCKFVHATVFEKEFFYRTGYIPPHALSHLNKNADGRPDTASTSEGGQAEASSVFPNSPPGPVIQPGVSGVASTSGGCAEKRTSSEVVATTATTIVVKRQWCEFNEPGTSGRDDAVPGPSRPDRGLIIKCFNCDISEYMIQSDNTKLEKLVRSHLDLDKKMVALNEKRERQLMVMNSLLRQNSAISDHYFFSNGNPRNHLETNLQAAMMRIMLGTRELTPPSTISSMPPSPMSPSSDTS